MVRAFFPVKDFDVSTLAGIKDPSWKMLVPLFVFTIFIIGFGLFSDTIVKFFSDVAAGVY